jgi:hypothetical protein
MTYRGKVQQGVVVFEGDSRPREGAEVQVQEVTRKEPIGEGLDRLAGKGVGLPADLATKHDQYRRERAAS